MSKSNVAVLDSWDGSTTFPAGAFDKLDITAFNGDVLFQVFTPSGDWQPIGGQLVRAGTFKSMPGFTAVYPPGPTQVRFQRAKAGVGAVVDVEIWSADE